jgi:hypothetical protein
MPLLHCARLRMSSITHSFIYYIFIFKGSGITNPARTNLDTYWPVVILGASIQVFAGSRKHVALTY